MTQQAMEKKGVLIHCRWMVIGFKGQSRVILPTISSCYECSLDMLTPPTAVPLCTLASIPRQPAHCIEWASILEWPRVMGGTNPPPHLSGTHC